MGISSSGDRSTTTNTTGFGIQWECADEVDSTNIRSFICFAENVVVDDQPGTGFYWVGPATQGSVMQSCLSNANRGHGYAYDRGILSGRVNTALVSGCMTIDTCLFYNNLGHAAACGAPTDNFTTPSTRIVFDNCELAGNATDALVRYEDAEVYIRGTNCEIRASVFSGGGLIGGVWISGRNHWIRNNRYLDCTYAVTCGNYPELPTQGINIEGMTVIQTSTPDMDPAVVVEAGCSNIRVLNAQPSFIDKIITSGS
jgi:hypothetical protein